MFSEASDDSLSVDSESSRLSDFLDNKSSMEFTHSSSSFDVSQDTPEKKISVFNNTEELSKPPGIDPDKSEVTAGNSAVDEDSVEKCYTNEIDKLPDSEEASSSNTGLDKDTLANELVMGSDGYAAPVVPLGADTLGLGVTNIVKECMDEASEDSRESLNNEGEELDLTGIDDNEIDKVTLFWKFFLSNYGPLIDNLMSFFTIDCLVKFVTSFGKNGTHNTFCSSIAVNPSNSNTRNSAVCRYIVCLEELQ